MHLHTPITPFVALVALRTGVHGALGQQRVIKRSCCLAAVLVQEPLDRLPQPSRRGAS